MGRPVAAGAGIALAAQVLPAATWLAPVRRLVPTLESPMTRGTVAVTFDDGPHPEGTPAVLDALDELGWTATFFMLGTAVARHPDVAREVVARGHQAAVHGWRHRYLILRTPLAARRDLRKAVAVVTRATGQTPRWWRPPYGVLTLPALSAARGCGLRPLLWSAWGADWRDDTSPERIARTVLRGRIDGGTILLHDSDITSAAGSWRRTVAALPYLAEHLARAGIDVLPIPPRH